MIDGLSYIHPLDRGDASLPEAFTFPFRYTPHPLCVRSAALVQEKLKEMGVGVLRIEAITEGARSLTMTVDEDLDCSGLPELDFEVCVYDEGFIAGILERFTGSAYDVKEIDCWCTGGRTCRFAAGRAAGE